MCLVCHAYPAALLFFSVLCVCVGCLVWCLCPELYSQPGFWILTIFPVSFQFFFVPILMPPKCKRSEQQRPCHNTRLRPPPIGFVPDAFLTCCHGGLRRLPTTNHRTWCTSLHFSHCHRNLALPALTCHACYPAGFTSLLCNHSSILASVQFTPVSWIAIT